MVLVCGILTLSLLPLNLDGDEVFERSFDFSKFPNLQEVVFGVGWIRRSLPWIPLALSTLMSATSPRLSTVKVEFACPSGADRCVDALVESRGDDLRLIADEVARIDREFGGAVNFTVFRDPSFQAVFDVLGVRFHLCGVHDTLLPH